MRPKVISKHDIDIIADAEDSETPSESYMQTRGSETLGLSGLRKGRMLVLVFWLRGSFFYWGSSNICSISSCFIFIEMEWKMAFIILPVSVAHIYEEWMKILRMSMCNTIQNAKDSDLKLPGEIRHSENNRAELNANARHIWNFSKHFTNITGSQFTESWRGQTRGWQTHTDTRTHTRGHTHTHAGNDNARKPKLAPGKIGQYRAK